MVRAPSLLRGALCASVVCFAAVLPATSAAAPTPLPPTAKQRIVLDHAKLVAVSTSAPIAHQPFPVVDPKTNKPVSPTQMLTGPKGEQVSAGEYWANVNKFEKYLNDRGLSHRTAAPVTKMDRVHADDGLVSARIARLAAVKKPVSTGLKAFESSGRLAPTPADITKYSNVHATHAAVLHAAPAAPPPPPTVHGPGSMVRTDRELDIHQSYPLHPFAIGGDHFGAEFGGSERVDSGQFHKSVAIAAQAKAAIFFKNYQLLDTLASTAGSFGSTGAGSAVADASCTIYGFEPFPPTHLTGASGKPELFVDRKTLFIHSWGPEFPGVNISVGPFEVEFTVTQAAHVQVDSSFKVLYDFVRADLIPATSLGVAVSASVGIPGIELGVRGKLRVFEQYFDMSDQAELTEPGSNAKLVVTTGVRDHLDALSGSLGAFAKVGWDPFSKTFEVDISSPPAISDDSELVNTSVTYPVMPPPMIPPPPPPLASVKAPAPPPPAPPATAAKAPTPASTSSIRRTMAPPPH